MTDEDDHDLLRLWRETARETPGELLDRRILRAAQVRHHRSRLWQLAATLAACLMLALLVQRPQPAVAPARPHAPGDPAMFGLYEGREIALLADPVAMHQVMDEKGPREPAGEFVTP